MGEGRRDARGHPDPQLPRAEGVHARRRQADRRHVREGRGAERREGPARSSCRPASPTSTFPATTCWSRSARRTRSRGSSATSASTFDEWGMPVVDKVTMASTLPGVFFGGDAAFGPKNIIWAVAHGHDAAISIDLFCRGEDLRQAAAAARQPRVAEDGHPRVELRQRDHADTALPRAAQGHGDRAEEHQDRGRAGLRSRSSRSPRRSAASTATCRRCSPTSCASSATPASTSARWTASRSPPNGDEAELRTRLQAPALQPDAGPLRVRRRSRPAA